MVQMTDPIPSLFQAIFLKPSTSGCVPQTNDYCHVVNALHELLRPSQNQTNLDWIMGPAFDGTTLDEILLLSIQQFALFISDNPQFMLDDFQYILQDLVRIIGLLSDKGTTAVTWSDLKPYVRRFLQLVRPAQDR